MSIIARSIFPLPSPRRRFLAAFAALALVPLAFAAVPAAAAETVTVLALGDSLTAGYGLKQGEGFADQLQTAFRKMGRDRKSVV